MNGNEQLKSLKQARAKAITWAENLFLKP
jgi:hypothetical protein